jgi:hypothetical protein
MNGMKLADIKLPVKIALMAAMPIEALNIVLAGALFDPGPPDPRWGWKLFSYQWVALHYPGMLSLDWLTRILGSEKLGMCVVIVSGYLETVLLLAGLILGLRWMLRHVGIAVLRQDEQRP